MIVTSISEPRVPRPPQAQPAGWDDQPEPAVAEMRLVSLFMPAPHLDPLTFFRQAQGRERFYWAEPSGAMRSPLTLAGSGVAAEVRVAPVLPDDQPVSPIHRGLRFHDVEADATRLFTGAVLWSADGQPGGGADALARPRLFGGFAFRDDFVPDNTWSVFSPAHFLLPHYQLVERDGQRFLTINALVAAEEDLTATREALREALRARAELPAVDNRATGAAFRPRLSYPMDYQAWRAMVGDATGAIAAGTLEKVVLARVCELRTGGRIDAADVLPGLADAYPDCYRFVFEPQPHHAFFGATPELLVRRAGREVETMALAGSTRRGASAGEDATLALRLQASAKDRHEHALVVDAIAERLVGLTEQLDVPSTPGVLRLRNIQHLLTPIRGRLPARPASILALAEALHPTPAMGGVPVQRALAFLQRAEPVPRGWYAAPIGWFDAGLDGTFAVAIRSAVTQHDRAWLYAGAGIVGDSDPEREWAETALKFRPMLEALGAREGA